MTRLTPEEIEELKQHWAREDRRSMITMALGIILGLLIFLIIHLIGG